MDTFSSGCSDSWVERTGLSMVCAPFRRVNLTFSGQKHILFLPAKHVLKLESIIFFTKRVGCSLAAPGVGGSEFPLHPACPSLLDSCFFQAKTTTARIWRYWSWAVFPLPQLGVVLQAEETLQGTEL